ncbi:MAG: hypothetical protein Q7R39_18620 [Dehalococcoidia bacterium]|nr:hypothetical protein [Dehalococcoidia bacterium]
MAIASVAGATSTPTATSESVAATLLARGVAGLEQAKGFRFTIEAVHHWQVPGGQAYDWAYTGEGAAILPSRFYSVMRGPVDALFEVKMIDGKVTNVDTRGQHPNASTAFGGPGVGAAPFTVIAYLKNSAPQGPAQAASLNGIDTQRLAFSPDLAKVSATDASHATIQAQVQTAQGSVWIDAKTGRVAQETVTVQSKDSGGLPQTVTISLKFSDYDAPVEIN